MSEQPWDYSRKPRSEADVALDQVLAGSTVTKGGKNAKAKAREELFGAASPTPPEPVPLPDRRAYTNEDLVEWIVLHPGCTHAEIGRAFGRTVGWFSTVLVTDDFQKALDPFRGEIRDPAITATLQQRFAGLLVRSVDVIQAKLNVPNPDAALVMEAAKLGVRALGLGMSGRDQQVQQAPQSLESLADRLSGLITNRTKGAGIGSVPQASVIDVEAKEA